MHHFIHYFPHSQFHYCRLTHCHVWYPAITVSKGKSNAKEKTSVEKCDSNLKKKKTCILWSLILCECLQCLCCIVRIWCDILNTIMHYKWHLVANFFGISNLDLTFTIQTWWLYHNNLTLIIQIPLYCASQTWSCDISDHPCEQYVHQWKGITTDDQILFGSWIIFSTALM